MCGADCCQFQSQGQKICYRRIHLQDLQGQPDGSSWLVKFGADFGSAQNIQLLPGFFATTALLALPGVDSLVDKDTEVKLGRPL